jgi:ubiquinone/menaquinone biosynthesis C-methylase UbiE
VTEDNEAFWSSTKRAQGYSARSHLYPAEERFLHEFRDLLPQWRMLDLGIGGGRSTVHFAPMVAEYVGTEYSQVMLDKCRSRFRTWSSEVNLRLADARDLSEFPSSCFDFVLFSFNGLDEVDHGGRMAALAEIRRVLRPDGFFLFSSHNLRSVDSQFSFVFARHPARLARSVWKYVRIRLANRRLGDRRALHGHTLIHDYPFDWNKFTYYVDSDEQLAQLEQCGFRQSKLYLPDGPQCASLANSEVTKQPWLYYLARA